MMRLGSIIIMLIAVLAFRPVNGLTQTAVPENIRKGLEANDLLSPGRTLVAARLVCSMLLDGKRYRVVDVIERLQNQAAPRGYQRIVVFTPDMTLAYQLPYTPPAKPVGCHGSDLQFSDPVQINNTLPSGRNVSFANGAEDATVLPDQERHQNTP